MLCYVKHSHLFLIPKKERESTPFRLWETLTSYENNCSFIWYTYQMRAMFRLVNKLLMWIDAHLLSLSPAYLLGQCNQIADELSRSKPLSRAWQIYKEMIQVIWNISSREKVNLLVSVHQSFFFYEQVFLSYSPTNFYWLSPAEIQTCLRKFHAYLNEC